MNKTTKKFKIARKGFDEYWNIFGYLLCHCNWCSDAWLYPNYDADVMRVSTTDCWSSIYVISDEGKEIWNDMDYEYHHRNLYDFNRNGTLCVDCGIFTGLIAELIYKSGNYASQTKAVLTCGVFSMWAWGNFIPLFFNREAYWATRQSFGEEYITTLNSLMPMWLCPVLLIASFVLES